MEQLVENIIEKKVGVDFTAAIGGNQVKKIATNATVDIMKDEEYVQNLGAERFTNLRQ